LLSDVRVAKNIIRLKGIDGFQMMVKEKRMLKDICSTCKFRHESKCLTLCRGGGCILHFISSLDRIYSPSFTQRTTFKHTELLYVAGWSDCKVLNTADENNRYNRKAGIKRTMEANTRHLIMDGSIDNTKN
jgi:hypothetical protein